MKEICEGESMTVEEEFFFRWFFEVLDRWFTFLFALAFLFYNVERSLLENYRKFRSNDFISI